MITAIHIENFKGIRERVKIDIKPITLLFGPNSAGKSTVVQAIHYAREILERGNLDPDRTMIGGAGVDLGGFRNFLHRTTLDLPELNRTIVLRFDLDVTKAKLGLPYSTDSAQDFSYDEETEDEWIAGSLDEVQQVFVEIRVRWSHILGRPIVTNYSVGHEARYFAVVSCSDDGTDPHISYLDESNSGIKKWRDGGLSEIRENLAAMDDDAKEILIEEMAESLKELDPATKEAALAGWERTFLSDTSQPAAAPSYESEDPVMEKKLKIDLVGHRTVIPQPGDVLRIADSEGFDEFFSRAIVGPVALLRSALSQFRYLGPVREVPPRHHAPALTYEEEKWTNGLAAWDRLAQDETLRRAASQWLEREDRLNTGYKVTVKKFKEIDLEQSLALELLQWDEGIGHVDDPGAWFRSLPTKHRLVLEKGPEALELQPYDVGIGLAKMVPVVVAALDKRAGIVAIEEPEANIHPRWQVGLGDLFIQKGVQDGQTFLLETHSEHLILRLLRRVRETAAGEVPPEFALRPADLSVVYVDNDGRKTILKPLRVDEDGEFIDRWPDGFFEERAEELF